jgi:hypothetical protein
MNDALNQWQENNERYLAAALNWLRLRLNSLTAVFADDSQAKGTRRGLSGILSGRAAEPDAASSAELAAAKAEMDETAAVDPLPALLILARRFGLSPFEQELLLLCAAMELDTRIPALCARAQDDPGRRYPTFALALALFDGPVWEVMSPERPLRTWRFIEINQPSGQPLTTSAITADERIVNYLKGLNYLDDRLLPFLVPFESMAINPDELPPSQQTAVTQIKRYWQPRDGSALPIIQLLGLDNLSKQQAAQIAAHQLNLNLYRLPVELLPTELTQLETVARLWQRESILMPVALFLDAHDADSTPQSGGQSPPLNRFLAHSQGVFFLSTREIHSGTGPVATAVEIDKPTPAEQQKLWQEALAGAVPESPPLLASQFNLNAATIRQIVGTAVSAANGSLTHEQLWDACLVNTRPRLDLLAQRIDPKATWDDIVLTGEVAEILHQIAAQVHHRNTVYDTWGFREKMSRGLGINALFGGESGTGKTMAAEVLANELRLNLYRIDLSAVVSKYIGETEKNLRRLFDAAEDGGAILFFDEADALFGKRSEVKDSHDRYANIEVNYLLQRMEAYRGLAILATNMKSALDQAFMRRLRFVVTFAFPNAQQRRAIWQRIFPPGTRLPEAGLDYDSLARLNLTGGSIQNVALNAAFLAAHSDQPVTMPLIFTAARSEFRKLERPIREADFRL